MQTLVVLIYSWVFSTVYNKLKAQFTLRSLEQNLTLSVKLYGAVFKDQHFLLWLLDRATVILTKHKVDYICSCDCFTAFFTCFGIEMTLIFISLFFCDGCIYLHWQVDDVSAAAAA